MSEITEILIFLSVMTLVVGASVFVIKAAPLLREAFETKVYTSEVAIVGYVLVVCVPFFLVLAVILLNHLLQAS